MKTKEKKEGLNGVVEKKLTPKQKTLLAAVKKTQQIMQNAQNAEKIPYPTR